MNIIEQPVFEQMREAVDAVRKALRKRAPPEAFDFSLYEEMEKLLDAAHSHAEKLLAADDVTLETCVSVVRAFGEDVEAKLAAIRYQCHRKGLQLLRQDAAP